jgi:hypothetical protein
VITDATILLLAPVAGFLTALWLLLLWLGDGGTPEGQTDFHHASDTGQLFMPPEPDAPFVPMPAHLKTSDEIVSWMTKELPRQLKAYGE